MEHEDDEPHWWKERLQRIKVREELMRAERAEIEAKREAWEKLRIKMTPEEADAYLFHLTKLGSSGADIARTFGLSSVSHRIRRHKRRMEEANHGG